MLLKEVLDLSNNYWITAKGKLISLKHGTHEYYLMDNGLSYASAYKEGLIRISVTKDETVSSIQLNKKALTNASIRATLKFLSKLRVVRIFIDSVKVNNGRIDITNSEDVDFTTFAKKYMRK